MYIAPHDNRWYRLAFWLAILTVAYNLLEGLVSVWFGLADESLTLFGFGLDSFVEMISGLGILAMVLRIWWHPGAPKGRFEKTALQITGTGFYGLVAILSGMALYNLATGHRPETTLAGAVIALISIFVMWALIHHKTQAGLALGSEAILADAKCARVCMYMSGLLLASSLIYALSGIWFVDSLGALGLAYLSFTEGREAFAKANGAECGCHSGS
jgi:divalent metal cation (Fe/Co/Zn/Cd) transporter